MPGSNGNTDYWDLKRNTQVKHDILSSYLLRWASILSGGRGGARRLAFHYVDVWCEYLRLHAIRIYSPMLDTPERRAEVLLKRIHRGDVEDGAKTRDLWRRGWSRLGTAGDLAEAIAVLEGLGWVRREEVKPKDGGRPSEILRLHPELRK